MTLSVQPPRLRHAGSFLLPLMLLAGSNAVGAAIITQSETFDFSAGPVSGSGGLQVVSNTDFTATFSPFDSSRGTLESFTVAWDLDFSASGTISGGSSVFNGSTSGGLSLAGSTYDGTGGGGGDGGSVGEAVAVDFTNTTSTTFLPANAGVSYDPDILSTVTGSTDFAVAFTTQYSINYQNISDVLGAASGTVTLTYTYAAAVPEPAPLGLVSLGLLGVFYRRARP